MSRRLRAAPALAAALALAVPAAASADVRLDGHGFGHGVGLSQYGAFGYARDGGHSFRWIVGHYYPGTRLRTVAPGRIRVRLARGRAAQVSLATVARDPRGRVVRLKAARTYRLVPWKDGVRIADPHTDHTVARLHGGVRVTGSGAVRLLGRAENGVSGGRYRGLLRVLPDAAGLLVVDDVDLEQYLWGVVPAEMPASWPAQALRAQAVVARSYAVARRRPSAAFDLFADTRSQVFRGLAGESPSSTAAVGATRRLVVRYGDHIADTLFNASSGGRTAAAQESFDTAPIPYLVSVDDPYDRLSPYHDWSVRFTNAEAEAKLGDAVKGLFTGLEVTATTPTGRARTVRVTGTEGTTDVSASTVRARLGLRSSWFTVAAS